MTFDPSTRENLFQMGSLAVGLGQTDVRDLESLRIPVWLVVLGGVVAGALLAGRLMPISWIHLMRGEDK